MSRRRHPGAHEEEHENHERWLLTYADLITLLLALFMMLYAMSVLDLKKYQAFQQAFTQGMGKHVHALPGDGDPPNGEKVQTSPGAKTGKPVPTPSPVSDQLQPLLDDRELKALKAFLEKELKKAHMEDEVSVGFDSRGLVINIVSAVLFDSGQAALTSNGQALLKSLGVVLRSMRNPLVVEGHTDSVPISTVQFPSNWELSTSRATAVLRYLVDSDHLLPARMSASGYADTKPLETNSTDAGRTKNRRVDVVVVAAHHPDETAATPSASPHTTPSPANGAPH
jgi:chemotaxis protein MotB